MQATEDRGLLIRYLLQDLSEGEQGRVEERYFDDDNFYSNLIIAEDELIDSYVLGELSPADRTKFERVYLANPQKLKKIELNRILLDLVIKPLPAPPPQRQSFFSFPRWFLPGQNISPQYAVAGLLVIGILFGFMCWLLFENGRMRGNLEQARSQWQQKENDYQRELAALKQPTPVPGLPPNESSQNLNANLPKEGQQKDNVAPQQAKRIFTQVNSRESVGRGRGPATIVTFAILRGGIRTLDGGAHSGSSLIIPRNAILVRLRIDLERNEYTEYRLSLQEVGGTEVWRQPLQRNRSNSSAQQIEVELPATLFKNRDYLLKVTGSDAPGDDQILAFHQITVVNRNIGREQPEGASPR